MSPSATYTVYGLPFESDFPFVNSLVPSNSSPQFAFTGELEPDTSWEKEFEHVYSSSFLDRDGEPFFKLLQCGGDELLRFKDCADFLFTRRSIRWGRIDGEPPVDTENLFLSSVLAYWLERLDILALHASAVEIDGGVVGFLAPTGTGKSSLAASFVFGGYPLVTDDVLPIVVEHGACRARGGYPTIKLNPDIGRRHLGSSFDDLRLFRPPAPKRCWPLPAKAGKFQAGGGPLRCLFLLARVDHPGEETGISVVEKRSAVIEILKAAFTPVLVEGMGMAERRLGRLAELVEQVPVKVLRYGSDLDALPGVVAAVVRDVRQDVGRSVR